MKRPSQPTRLSWRPILSVASFAALAFCMLSVDWSEAQAQDVKAKAKAKAKDAAKKALEKKAFDKKGFLKKDFFKQEEIVPPRVIRLVPGTGKKLEASAVAKIIDDEINRRLAAEDLKPSGTSADAEFLRRVSLDLVGVVPTPDQVVEFLDSADPDKRAKTIERLLSDERFGQFYGEIWTGLLVPRDTNNRILDTQPMIKWLAEEFNKNTPLNKVVFDLLTASGKQEDNAGVTYFVANPAVDKITDNVSRMFLGVQLQCAQCHNHPFTDWKQKEYWGMAQFFMKTRVTVNPQMAKKKGESPAIAENNAPLPKKKGVLPESAMNVKAKFLGAEEPRLSTAEPYRPVLAQWVCSPDNPYFAKAMVNRFWHHLFGRGLVNPVDDMHDNNLPSHPELLASLTEQFKANNFDVKFLIRAICTSDTYQRTSRPENGNGDDRELYSHRAVRALLPEQLYESLISVTGRELIAKKGDFAAPFAKKKGAGGPRDQFINFFRVTDEQPDVLDYQVGIPQALRMMNAPITNALGQSVNRAIKTVGADPEKMVEQLYLTGVSRRPSVDETRRLVAFVRSHPVNPVAAYTDILWSLLNSSEFALNH
jgi:hypothetical protein